MANDFIALAKAAAQLARLALFSLYDFQDFRFHNLPVLYSEQLSRIHICNGVPQAGKFFAGGVIKGERPNAKCAVPHPYAQLPKPVSCILYGVDGNLQDLISPAHGKARGAFCMVDKLREVRGVPNLRPIVFFYDVPCL